MGQMQDKHLAAMKAIVDDAGLDFVRQSGYANTGIIFVQPKHSFETLVHLRYEYHDTYASIHFAIPEEARFWSLKYTQEDRMQQVIDLLAKYIEPHRVKK